MKKPVKWIVATKPKGAMSGRGEFLLGVARARS
jgi:hypothetical protein